MHSLATTRIHNHQLQTPHVILRHPNGHSVQVIGVLHYALPTTWIAINKRLRVLSDRGWAVHYEQVRPVPNMTARERGIHRQFQQVRSILGKKLGRLGAVYQKDGINYPRGALNTDTTVREVYATYKGSLLGLAARIKLTGIIFGLIPASDVVRLLGSEFANESNNVTDGIFDNSIVLDRRNAIAVTHCVMATPQNVVMVWGAAHVDGIVSLLQKCGYRVTGHHWTTMLPLHS